MIFSREEEELVRRYLLGKSSPEERTQIEENLLRDDDYADQILMIEDELIDDYVRGVMSASEQELFDRNFLFSPARREKLLMAQAAVNYVMANQVNAKASANEEILLVATSQYISRVPRSKETSPNERHTRQWWQTLFAPRWKIAVYAMLMLGLFSGVWWLRRGEMDVTSGMAALNQAYREQRPLEARITGFSYATFIAPSRQLGPKEKGSETSQLGKVDNAALDRARVLLFGQTLDSSDVNVLHLQGKYYLTQKDFETAIEQLQQAVRLAPGSAQLHSDLGAALLGKIDRDGLTDKARREADVEEAFRQLNEALRLNPDLPEALFNRALLHRHERLRRQAKADWERYLHLDAKSAWAEEARLNLKEIDAALSKVGLQGKQLHQQLLDAWSRQDKESGLRAVSLSYSFNGNYIVERLLDEFLAAKIEGHKDSAEEKLQILHYIGAITAEKLDDRYFYDLAQYYERATPQQILLLARARQMMSEANSFSGKSENDCAVEIYEQAKELFAQIGDLGEELFAAAWIGHCHHQRSATQQNLRAFTELVPVLTEKKYRWMLSNALCGLANGHNSAGQFSQAITDCVQCGLIADELGDQTGVLRSQYILGGFYYELGKHEENLRLATTGQQLADKVCAELRYALPFYNLRAWSLSALGFHEMAVACQHEAVQIAEETKRLRLIAYAYIYQGRTYARRGWFAEAAASARHGINIGQQLGNDGTGQDFVHTGLLSLGHIQRAAGNFAEAIQSFDQVVDFYQYSKKQAYFYGAAKGRLLTLIAQGNNDAAQDELGRVLALYERFRESIREESNRNSFFDQEQNTYDVAINFAYTALNDPGQAYIYAELSRARSLLDEMVGGAKDVAGPQYPELVISAHARPAGNDDIRRQMPEQVQLLEYAVLDDKLIIWLISRESVVSRVVNLPANKLNEMVSSYLALIRQKPGKTDQRWREQSVELHDLLIRPIADLLDRQRQICVIPDKILTRLPFATLTARDTGRLLLEDYIISYSSSANVFLRLTGTAKLRAVTMQEYLSAVGNPSFNRAAFPGLESVPEAEEAAKGVAAQYPEHQLLIAEQATKTAVMRAIERADVAHLAMHYVPDTWSPMFSRLPLAVEKHSSESGVLQLYELYRLKLERLRLIVLAACQTRGESYYNGEGAVGVSRVFEAAGVPLVVASLWPVDSEATSELMITFHQRRKHSTQKTVAALQSAQLELLHHSTEYQHPYYWAAFVVTGGYCTY